MTVRRAPLLLVIAALALALSLVAGCGGGGDDSAAADGTIQQLKIAYTSGGTSSTADTWNLKGAADAASRSRVLDGGQVTSDIALSDGFLAVWTPESGQVISAPAQAAVSPDPFALADGLVEDGTLRAAGTVTRDGKELKAYTGPPDAFLLSGTEGTVTAAGAKVRYLRDEAAGRPVELRIPAASVAPKGGQAAQVPAQRFVVTGFRQYPATEKAMEVFDLSAIYDGTGTTTTP